MGSSSSRRCRISSGVCVAVALILAFLACCVACASGAVPALYVLGDSQADVGNNNYLPESLLRANFPHNGVDYPGGKATGRFSNGYNFVDLVASSLGLDSPPPYLSIRNSSNSTIYLKGINFASGGAGVSDLTNKGQCISFDEQIERDYSKVHAALVKRLGKRNASTHLGESLFVVAIGGNDIIMQVLFSPVTELLSTQKQFISTLADTLKRQLQSLYDLGMRRLFIVGAAPLGCCPLLREQSPTKACQAEANSMAATYNDAAAELLRGMAKRHRDMSYAFFDTSTALLQAIHDPKARGYTEVKAACCGLGVNNAMFLCAPDSKYCSNRTTHMFWDLVHPTEMTSKKLMNVAFNGSAPLVSPINVKELTQC
uniref:GDSL esterase/lipase n=2 Tax=Oryza brachyantha TaxID=4533 RepID=J3LQG7_ORYBR